MYKKDYLTTRFLIGVGAILFFFSIYLVVITLSPFLKGHSLFYQNIIGSYLSIFILINIISWITLGQVGGVLILIASCFLILIIVLRCGVLFYNIYMILFGISAFIGYKIFLNIIVSKKQALAELEVLEVDKNTVATKIYQKQADIISAKNRVQRYLALKDMTEALSATLNLEEITKLVTDNAFNIIGRSNQALLFLIDESKKDLGFKTGQGEMFDTWMVKQRRPLIIEDLDNDFRFSGEALRNSTDREFKSVIGAPIVSEMKVIGALRMVSKEKAVYTQDDLRLLNIISDLAAVSIENSRLYQRTNELAIRDGLTGLYVQRFFKESLEAELKQTKDQRPKTKAFSILMIDVDYFKDCNDKYGHAAGDIILAKVAQVLKENIGEGHVVSRYGGEEFSVLLLGLDKREAIKISGDIRKKVEAAVFTLRRHELKITVSIGISSFPDDGNSTIVLLKKADENLYKAKRGGRNIVWPNSI